MTKFGMPAALSIITCIGMFLGLCGISWTALSQMLCIQQELAQAHEAAARYREDSQKAKEETARLRAQLDVEKSNTEQMITQTTQLEMLWKQYRSSQQILERKLQEVGVIILSCVVLLNTFSLGGLC